MEYFYEDHNYLYLYANMKGCKQTELSHTSRWFAHIYNIHAVIKLLVNFSEIISVSHKVQLNII